MKRVANAPDKRFFFFFIGTNAELIKHLPVLREFHRRGIRPFVIASGQNSFSDTGIREASGIREGDLRLSKKEISQKPSSLFFWFIKTLVKGAFTIPRFTRMVGAGRGSDRVMIVHGDTISTVMGACLGKLLRFRVAHLESGLRSFNLLKPFPEELNRIITSWFADYCFCPNEWAMGNLASHRCEKTDTRYNTIIESLELALQLKPNARVIRDLGGEKYFVFVVHRQENIYNKRLLEQIISSAVQISSEIRCVFVLHEPTKEALERFGLLERITENESIIAIERQDYFDFMQVISACEFLITDGGSNQEEAYYLGKPCLILRCETERIEGLGNNAVLYDGHLEQVAEFVNEYQKRVREVVIKKQSPSAIIVDALVNRNE